MQLLHICKGIKEEDDKQHSNKITKTIQKPTQVNLLGSAIRDDDDDDLIKPSNCSELAFSQLLIISFDREIMYP